MLSRLWCNTSIRSKLTIIVTLACSAGLVLAGVAFMTYDRLEFKRNMVTDAEVLADVLGTNSTAAIVFNNSDDANELLAGLRAEEHVLRAAILRSDGELFASYARDGLLTAWADVLQEGHGYIFYADHLSIHREIILEDEMIGAIVLELDLVELSTRFGRFGTAVVIVTLVALLIAVLVISQLQKIISGPVRQLSDVASRVSENKDYSVRAHSHGNDEVGSLVRTFNEMLEQIQERDHELQKINVELEDRVRERTKELEIEVAERKLAEDTVRHSERRFRSLIENGSDIITIIAGDGTIQYNSPSVKRVLGFEAEELTGDNLLEHIHDEDKDLIATQFAAVLDSPAVMHSVECRHRHKNGEWRYLEASAVNLLEDETVVGIVVNSRDITDRKEAEAKMQASLREKEVLLKEIHHRVKNNLQVITSLLNLQSRGISDEKSREMFKDSQTRVKSMALIHEKLYRSTDLARIDFADYVSSLTSYLAQSFRNGVRRIDIVPDIDNIHLSVDTAMPCGLIINELVSNSLKHAFGESESGTIFIDFRCLEDNEMVLRVADDGCGLPADFASRQTESLGLQLVNTLTGQLGGTIEVNSEGGTSFTIKFHQTPANENTSLTASATEPAFAIQ